MPRFSVALQVTFDADTLEEAERQGYWLADACYRELEGEKHPLVYGGHAVAAVEELPLRRLRETGSLWPAEA